MLFTLHYLLFNLWLNVLAPQHPFYLGMTELMYNEKEKRLEISVRIFSDDLERALRKKCNCKIDLLNTDNQSTNAIHLQQYINMHLQIHTGNKPLKLEWVGYEHEQESTWTYLEAKLDTKGNKILVNNDLLYDILDAQVNLVRIKTKDKDRTWQLKKPDTKVETEW